MEKVDVFIIDTGPAGMAAARAAKLSKKELSVTAIRREPNDCRWWIYRYGDSMHGTESRATCHQGPF